MKTSVTQYVQEYIGRKHEIDEAFKDGVLMAFDSVKTLDDYLPALIFFLSGRLSEIALANDAEAIEVGGFVMKSFDYDSAVGAVGDIRITAYKKSIGRMLLGLLHSHEMRGKRIDELSHDLERSVEREGQIRELLVKFSGAQNSPIIVCPKCDGGIYDEVTCTVCKGTGFVKRKFLENGVEL